MRISRDEYTVRYRFQLDLARHVLQLGGRGLAWRFVSLPPDTVADVTIAPVGSDLAINVTTQSDRAESLLGYLRSGAIEHAGVLAERVLWERIVDPISSAIGGYYLLRVGRFELLADWSRDLSTWFPWLPDGAVINAWQHLRSGRGDMSDPAMAFDSAAPNSSSPLSAVCPSTPRGCDC